MASEVLSTWKEIAAYLRVSVDYARELARKHKDFPVFKDNRVFSTKEALETWIRYKGRG